MNERDLKKVEKRRAEARKRLINKQGAFEKLYNIEHVNRLANAACLKLVCVKVALGDGKNKKLKQFEEE